MPLKDPPHPASKISNLFPSVIRPFVFQNHRSFNVKKYVLMAYKALGASKRNSLGIAVFELISAKITISLYSFKDLVKGIKSEAVGIQPRKLQYQQSIEADDICWAIGAVAAHLPWTSSCLVRALAAQRLLKRKGIPGVLYLGTFLDAHDRSNKLFKAHAWVQCGDKFIVGEFSDEPYSPVAAFSWE